MKQPTELDIISLATGAKPSECSCDTCVNMCKTTPCIGTPQEMLTLMNNGYYEGLEFTEWAAGTAFGYPHIYMITPKQMPDGACYFLRDNLCMLHDLGLKPAEGKLANHKPHEYDLLTPPVPCAVASSWLYKPNEGTILRVFTGMLKVFPNKKKEDKQP